MRPAAPLHTPVPCPCGVAYHQQPPCHKSHACDNAFMLLPAYHNATLQIQVRI